MRRAFMIGTLCAALCPGLWISAENAAAAADPSAAAADSATAPADSAAAPAAADSAATPAPATAPEAPARRNRRINPIRTAAAETQAVNVNAGDTAWQNAQIRARSTHYHRDDGYTVYVDTISGEEWIDSASHVNTVPKMKYPLLNGVSAHVDLWDPIMRAFGQKYGLIGFGVKADLHNRYFPTFEAGLGMAHKTPDGGNFTYRSPLSVYFKIGADYNFLYNSNPDYKWFAGFRVGFAPFSWSVDDVHLDSSYWGEDADFALKGLHSSAVWWELCTGLQVKIWGPVSAGWLLRYHSIIHESANPNGQPWYIPGYGTRGGAITGSLIITYELDLNRLLNKHPSEAVINEMDNGDLPPLPAPGQGAAPGSHRPAQDLPADTVVTPAAPSL